MKYFLGLFTFLAFTSVALACEVNLYEKIYRLDLQKNLQAKDLMYNTNCNHIVTAKISQLVSAVQGTISSDFIENEILKDTKEEITITPQKISFLDLKAFLNDKLLANDVQLTFDSLKSLQNIHTIKLTGDETLSVNCETCNTLGDKNIKLVVSKTIEGTETFQWIQAKLYSKVRALTAKRNISFQQTSLNPDDFTLKEILTAQPENLVTTFDNIKFYKATKLILQNAPLSHMDILPINLVTYGTPVKVTLNNSNVQLQKILMPTRSARLNETIELNGANNKKIIGKVIDFNKVVIEL